MWYGISFQPNGSKQFAAYHLPNNIGSLGDLGWHVNKPLKLQRMDYLPHYFKRLPKSAWSSVYCLSWNVSTHS